MKTTQLLLAKKQFIEDLKQDQDFIAFKEKCLDKEYGTSYGVVKATHNYFLIDLIGLPAQSLIIKFRKENA